MILPSSSDDDGLPNVPMPTEVDRDESESSSTMETANFFVTEISAENEETYGNEFDGSESTRIFSKTTQRPKTKKKLNKVRDGIELR